MSINKLEIYSPKDEIKSASSQKKSRSSLRASLKFFQSLQNNPKNSKNITDPKKILASGLNVFHLDTPKTGPPIKVKSQKVS